MIKKTKWKFNYYKKKFQKDIESIFNTIKKIISSKYVIEKIYKNKNEKIYDLDIKNQQYFNMAYNRIKNLMINKKDKIIEKFIQF